MAIETERPDVEAMTEVEIQSEQKKISKMIRDEMRLIDEASDRLHVLTSYKDELDGQLREIYAHGEGELQ